MTDELIYYDDDPADTAALCWLCTPCGIASVKRAAAGERESVERAVRRAFAVGYLVGAEAVGGNDEPTD